MLSTFIDASGVVFAGIKSEARSFVLLAVLSREAGRTCATVIGAMVHAMAVITTWITDHARPEG